MLARIERFKTICMCAAGLTMSLVIFGPQIVGPILFARPARFNDLRHFYVGALLARTPYDADLVARTQKRVSPADFEPNITLNRLPFYYAILSPMSRLPIESAQRLWLALLLLATILTWMIWPFDRSRLAVALCFSWPLAISLAMEQDLAFVMLAIAGGERLRVSQRPSLAGAAFSLALIKWHFMIFFPVLLVIRREYRLFAGWLAGAAVLVAISFADAGPHWPAQYLSILRGELRFGSAGEWVTLHAVALRFGAGITMEGAASVVVAGLVLFVIWRARSFEFSLAAALLGGLLLARHACVWDCTVILLPLILLSRWALPIGAIATVMLAPPVYMVGVINASWIVGVALLLLLSAMAAESWLVMLERYQSPVPAMGES
jgi:hypothetical protein